MNGHQFESYFEISQRDVAKKFEVKQQSIQKLDKKAMEKFRKAFEARGLELKDFL